MPQKKRRVLFDFRLHVFSRTPQRKMVDEITTSAFIFDKARPQNSLTQLPRSRSSLRGFLRKRFSGRERPVFAPRASSLNGALATSNGGSLTQRRGSVPTKTSPPAWKRMEMRCADALSASYILCPQVLRSLGVHHAISELYYRWLAGHKCAICGYLCPTRALSFAGLTVPQSKDSVLPPLPLLLLRSLLNVRHPLEQW